MFKWCFVCNYHSEASIFCFRYNNFRCISESKRHTKIWGFRNKIFGTGFISVPYFESHFYTIWILSARQDADIGFPFYRLPGTGYIIFYVYTYIFSIGLHIYFCCCCFQFMTLSTFKLFVAPEEEETSIMAPFYSFSWMSVDWHWMTWLFGEMFAVLSRLFRESQLYDEWQ
jgi:hypothetical protein